MRKAMIVLAAAVALSLPANAADDEFYGTYQLVSRTRTVVETGQVIVLSKDHGFITYGKDGRMMVISVRGNRPKAESIDKMTDQQRAELHSSMTAYGGTYKFDGKTIEHHIDISWNEVWTGTKQVRNVKRDGNRLIYTTRPAPNPDDGKMSISTLVWEKVK